MTALSWITQLINPKNKARLEALQQRWAVFPPALRGDDQAIGRYVSGCGATFGIHERCDFGCTACYLGAKANRQQPMPFEAVVSQLRKLRRYLGPGGNVQITSGEVTLLPVEDLINIVRAAIDLELSPMVMTHGDVFLHQPEYLERLVSEGGLGKVSIHVDLTQRGRKGFGLPRSEKELNQVRSGMAAMLRSLRRRTGRKLKAATTLTVNRENLNQLGDVVGWFLENLDSFRILSLQPQAKTGRTREDGSVATDEVWRVLEQSLGMPLNPHPFLFGHPACNRFSLMVAVETGTRRFLLQAVRSASPLDQKLVNRFLKDFSGLVLNERPASEIALKSLAILLRKPLWLLRLPHYILIRSWQERRHIAAVLAGMLRLRLVIRPFALVVHAFMSREEMETDLGRQRLEACVFKLAVGDRMVSMCEMNGTDVRLSTYDR